MPEDSGTNITIPDVINLNTIVSVASESAKVAWADEDCVIHHGTARHIVKSPDNFGFLNRDEDIRDGYLRVTMRSGFERALKVSELMPKVADGTFLKYDWSQD